MRETSDGGSRRKAEKRGHLAEWIGIVYLLLHGYRILALRYRTPLGEIDIIARKGDLIAFVEVKARARAQSAIDAVTPSTQHRIRAASDLWLARRADAHRLSRRYDILAISGWRLPRHVVDAF